MNFIIIAILAFIGSIALGAFGFLAIIKMLESLDNQEPFDRIHPAWTKDQVEANLKNSKK